MPSQSFQTKNYNAAASLGAAVSVQKVSAIYAGAGAPTFAAQKSSLYLRTDGSTTNDRAYINTDGNTTWTAITTAA